MTVILFLQPRFYLACLWDKHSRAHDFTKIFKTRVRKVERSLFHALGKVSKADGWFKAGLLSMKPGGLTSTVHKVKVTNQTDKPFNEILSSVLTNSSSYGQNKKWGKKCEMRKVGNIREMPEFNYYCDDRMCWSRAGNVCISNKIETYRITSTNLFHVISCFQKSC